MLYPIRFILTLALILCMAGDVKGKFITYETAFWTATGRPDEYLRYQVAQGQRIIFNSDTRSVTSKSRMMVTQTKNAPIENTKYLLGSYSPDTSEKAAFQAFREHLKNGITEQNLGCIGGVANAHCVGCTDGLENFGCQGCWEGERNKGCSGCDRGIGNIGCISMIGGSNNVASRSCINSDDNIQCVDLEESHGNVLCVNLKRCKNMEMSMNCEGIIGRPGLIYLGIIMAGKPKELTDDEEVWYMEKKRIWVQNDEAMEAVKKARGLVVKTDTFNSHDKWIKFRDEEVYDTQWTPFPVIQQTQHATIS